MLGYFKPLRAVKTIRTAMLAFIIFAAAFNCFRANENGGNENKRYKFVITEYGSVRGQTATDGDYLAFLGIPYAAPPTGNHRFMNPRPAYSWRGVYDAVRTIKCPQNGEGQEDCLVLNIFTPFAIQDSLLPVLVYIHGGSFLMGYGPTKGVKHLISQNIIVVTINYRLGALGFLCLGIKEAPGNAGLKDQVAALKFVKRNIAKFGGDPKQVTLYGMSAGGASVEYLMLSKMSKHLFHQAIIESGSVANPWALDTYPMKTAQKVAELADIPLTNYPKILVEHFRRIFVEILTESNFEYYTNLTDGTFGFAPCIEKNINGVNHFITSHPRDKLKKKKFHKMPTMFLFSTLEGLYLRSREFKEQNYRQRMEWNFPDFLPADLAFKSDKIRNETADNIQRFYFGSSVDMIQYLNYFGDSLILHGLLKSVEAHSQSCNHDVFLMEFGYKGRLGGFEEFNAFVNVAGHGDVAKYAFLNKQPDESDKTTVRRVSTLIANFVKYGHPTPTTTSLLPVRWPTVPCCGNITYLYLGQDFEVYSQPYWDRKTFWDNVYARAQKSRRW